MKQTLLSTLLLFAAGTLSAQVTLTQSDFPTTGDVYTLSLSDTNGVQPGNSGTNVTWNFAALNSMVGTQVDSFLPVLSTPYGTSYPQANLALHQLSPSVDYFVYFDVTTAAAFRVGNADTINTITYSDPVSQYVFPLSYGTTSSDTYYASYTDSNSGNLVHVHGNGSINADATGTLQLPTGTFSNLLRVHSTRNETDTIFSSSNIVVHVTENYYLWYQAGDYYPVLSIVSTVFQTPVSMIYRKTVGWRTPPPAGIAVISSAANFNVFPNPASSTVQLVTPGNGTIAVYSSDGKLLIEQEAQPEMRLDLSEFEHGVLLVIFRNEEFVLRKEILLTR